jgi:hypothetical protein
MQERVVVEVVGLGGAGSGLVAAAEAEEVGGYHTAGWLGAGGGDVFEQNGDHLAVGVRLGGLAIQAEKCFVGSVKRMLIIYT